MQKMFKRKIYSELMEWKTVGADTSALLIKGARRIGKSTVVEQFAKNNYKSYIMIDFSKSESKSIQNLLESGFGSLDYFFLFIQNQYQVKLYKHESLIIFDEVQFCPLARQMIKHLVADGRYHYVETGSLISIKKNIENILIPSEEMHISMYPMDFEEFLWACGNEVTYPILKQLFESNTPLGQSMHRSIMETYHTYMLVGGMPQAVSAYVQTNNFEMVEAQKKLILELYKEDCGKILKRNSEKCSHIISKIPESLSKYDKSFKPTAIRKGGKTRDYLEAIYSLEDSKMVLLCESKSDVLSDRPTLFDKENFKLYISDTGLLFTLAFQNDVALKEKTYEAILNDKMDINGGMFFENMVAQILKSTGHKLYFTKIKTKDIQNLQGIDFIIPRLNKFIPVEVKPARSGAHATLDRLLDKCNKKIEKAYVIHSKDLRVDGKIVYIPIYMTGFIE